MKSYCFSPRIAIVTATWLFVFVPLLAAQDRLLHGEDKPFFFPARAQIFEENLFKKFDPTRRVSEEGFWEHRKEAVILPDRMEISIETWPEEILYGDFIYVTFFVENKSECPIRIGVHDLFQTYVYKGRGFGSWTPVEIPGVPCLEVKDFYEAKGTYSTVSARHVSIQEVVIPPGEKRTIHADRFPLKARNDIFEQTGKNETIRREIRPFFKPKYKYCAKNPYPNVLIGARSSRELEEVKHLLFRKASRDMNNVHTAGGFYVLDHFFAPDRPNGVEKSDRALATRSHCLELESALSPGTLRDEIRLVRIQIQYLDGDENALEELQEWIADMEPLQQAALAADLSLPQGSSAEKNVPLIDMPNSPKSENAVKRYVEMRRKIDKMIRQYDILPKRVLCETPSY